MKKKTAFLLALLILMSLAACGEKTPASNNENTNPSSQQTENPGQQEQTQSDNKQNEEADNLTTVEGFMKAFGMRCCFRYHRCLWPHMKRERVSFGETIAKHFLRIL